MISLPNQKTKNDGVRLGIVKDNLDPDRLGRLKVVIPTYNDNTALDDLQWFYPVFPYGGYKDEGFFFLPAVGAEVVVVFPMGGETPLWIGCLNRKVDNPGPREATQEADDDHYWQRKQIKTRVGWIMWDDKEEYIQLKHNIGSFIVLDKYGDIDIRSHRHINLKAGKSVNISAEHGDFCAEAFNSFKMEAHHGDFTAEADRGKMALSALKDNVNICSGKKIHVMADTDIKLYANRSIFNTAAKKNIHFAAAKNIETYAKKQIKTHCEKEMLVSSKENMALSTSRDFIHFTEGKYMSTAGEIGIIQFGKSTDIIVKDGDLNISSLNGNFNMHSKESMILDTKKDFAIFAVKDITQFTDEKFRTMSQQDTNMYSKKNMNVRVSLFHNDLAENERCIAGKFGIYESSTFTTDIHAAIEIKEHTPMLLTEESKVQHAVRANFKHEKMLYWKTNSSLTIHNAGLYKIRAGLILLN